MPNDLTPARLRALIAAARNDKTGWCECCSQVIGADAISLMAYMDEHAPALAGAACTITPASVSSIFLRARCQSPVFRLYLTGRPSRMPP